MTPSTKILDHLIHLTPPGSVDKAADQWRKLGFTVLPGGAHADGRTVNSLVLLEDGVYVEIISFIEPPSPSDQHRWGQKSPGWIDFAFLGAPGIHPSVSETINDRAREAGVDVRYTPEIPGGRTKPDGKVLKWVLNIPEGGNANVGTLPFFCGDVTPREWRVPSDAANTAHECTATGVAHVRVVVAASELKQATSKISAILGAEPLERSDTETVWELETPQSSGPGVKLIIDASQGEGTTEKYGVCEVGVWVHREKERSEVKTPYGKLVWIPRP